MKHFAIIIPLMLASCASQRTASIHQIDRDSTYTSTRQRDSLSRTMRQRDSVYQRDSIYIYEKGDTIAKYVEKIKYKWQIRTDTLYRDRWWIDTVFINRTDSITVVKPVEVKKPIKWYTQSFIWIGRLCCLAVIFWVLFLYLKRKF